MKHPVGENRRTLALNTEYRVVQEDGKAPKIIGHAAVFNSPTPIWDFVEVISPGAFAETVTVDDIRCLYNHNSDYVLGRNTSGTLRLSEDEVGLAIECDAPTTQLINDLVLEPMRRGDITGMSFGFEVLEENWTQEVDGTWKRTIIKARVFEVSVVAFPAYLDTDASVRSALAHAGIEYDVLAKAVERASNGSLSDDDKSVLTRSASVLQQIASAQVRAGGSGDKPAQVRELELLKEQIRIARMK